MQPTKEDEQVATIISVIELASIDIKRAQADSESRLDKRALSIAVTHIETAQLWLANSRPD